MSKARKFIEDYTRTCSNELIGCIGGAYVPKYQPWITPDQALRAVELAREDAVDDICDWLRKCLPSYIVYCNDSGVLKGTEEFINDLKQAIQQKQ